MGIVSPRAAEQYLQRQALANVGGPRNDAGVTVVAPQVRQPDNTGVTPPVASLGERAGASQLEAARQYIEQGVFSETGDRQVGNWRDINFEPLPSQVAPAVANRGAATERPIRMEVPGSDVNNHEIGNWRDFQRPALPSEIKTPSAYSQAGENVIRATKPEQIIYQDLNGQWIVNRNPHVGPLDTIIPAASFPSRTQALGYAHDLLLDRTGEYNVPEFAQAANRTRQSSFQSPIDQQTMPVDGAKGFVANNPAYLKAQELRASAAGVPETFGA
ncbi:MAG: hypothetical protein NTY99_03800, partial [DPANN group archaeon]|nr:hypothetical protein [DPANN group archaeon]